MMYNYNKPVVTGLLTSQVLLSIIFLVHFFAVIAYCLHCQLSPYLFPISVFIAIGANYLFAHQLHLHKKALPMAVVLSFFMLTVSLLMALFYFDLSWDGQAYHQAAVYNLAGEWNPIYQSLHTPDLVDDRSVLFFPKNSWVFGAALLRLFGTVEIGKAYNFIILFAASSVVYTFCSSFKMPAWRAAMLTLLILLNPVVWSELSGYLNDGDLYLFFVIYIAAVILWMRDGNPVFKAIAALSAVCLINVKFTGLVFFLIASFFVLLYIGIRQRKQVRYFLAFHLLTGLMAVLVIGYNPYVTNIINRGNPFYPVMGSKTFPKGSDTNEKFETPKNMKGKSLLTRLLYANFGKPGNAPYNKEKNAQLANPLTTSPSTWQAYNFQETRVSGFGPYFGILLLLTIIALPIILLISKEFRLPVLLFLAALCVGLSLSKHFWWPRFFPIFWLVPVLPLFLLWTADVQQRLKDGTGSWIKIAKNYSFLLAAVIGINGTIVAFIHMKWETVSSVTLRTQLQQLSNMQRTVEVDYGSFKRSMEEKLQHWNISYIPVSFNHSSPKNHKLMSVVKGYPNQVFYRQR